MSDLITTLVQTASEQKSQQNQRKAAVVRTCGEEHTGKFVEVPLVGNSRAMRATAYFVTDPELAFISQLRFKFIIGNPLDPAAGAINSGGSGSIYPTPAGVGGGTLPNPFNIKDYPSVQKFFEMAWGNYIDIDGSWGSQCYDFAAWFWQNAAGQRLTWDSETLGHAVYNCWTSEYWRNYNTVGGKFELITNQDDVIAGDWCVFGAPVAAQYGHIAMALQSVKNADGTYNAQWLVDRTIPCLGQNQGGRATPNGGADVNVAYQPIDSTAGWLGAFRWKGTVWDTANVNF